VIRKEAEYLCLESNTSGSRPRELFEDEVAEMEERYAKDKVKVKAALRAVGFTMTKDTDWTDFLAVLEPPEIQDRLKCGVCVVICVFQWRLLHIAIAGAFVALAVGAFVIR
jgi:hypothetical protein